MKIILDECLPKRLGRHLSGHDVTTVHGEGLSGLGNGKLLSAIQDRFDAFITIDANLEYQQALRDRPIAIIVVKAASNRLDDLLPLVPGILAALSTAQPGTLVHVKE